MIRAMRIEDYDEVFALWQRIDGFVIREIEDSREGIAAFLQRNPATSVVAQEEGRIVGSILCGHDGRRGCLYHVCVERRYRKQGVGSAMVSFSIKALEKEGVKRVHLIAFTRNELGNSFWQGIGWTRRNDLYYYDYEIEKTCE